MRALGIDLGSKRIGVAISDRSGTIATPLVVLQRSGTRLGDYRSIAALAVEHQAECVVIGLPINMSGSMGVAAESALNEADEMASVVSVPVYTYDERLTTVTADQILMEQKMKAQARRRVVDKIAAAVMLQSWLDHRRHQLMDANGE
jgi:putative Holliday junction resolvase